MANFYFLFKSILLSLRYHGCSCVQPLIYSH